MRAARRLRRRNRLLSGLAFGLATALLFFLFCIQAYAAEDVAQTDVSGTPSFLSMYDGKSQTLGTGLTGTVGDVEISYKADNTYYGVDITVFIEECSAPSYADHCHSVGQATESGRWDGPRTFHLPAYEMDPCKYYKLIISGSGPWGMMGSTYVYGSAYDAYRFGSYSDESPFDLFFIIHGVSRTDERGLCPNPVIIIPGVLGSWQKDGAWMIDPVFHTYDNLIDTFLANGYEASTTLFTFPYDWRNSNADSARPLRQKIEDIKNACQCSKVDIVAHSMGGLVARSYIESADYGNDVGKIAFLGVPHQGSPVSYLTWEGGEVVPTLLNQLIKFYLTYEALRNHYLGFFDYVRNRPIVSFRELLPTFDYLKDASTTDMLSYPSGYPQNPFLEGLKANQAGFLNGDIDILNIAGEYGTGTVSAIKIDEPVQEASIWTHGRPLGFESDYGDGTVPIVGSTLGDLQSISVPSDHASLPTAAEGTVFRFLAGTDATVLIDRSLPSRFFFQTVLSPADILVTMPDGRRIGKSHSTGQEVNEIPGAFYSGSTGGEQFVTIPDPADGQYGVEVQGTGDGGEYTLLSSVITAATSTESAISSVIDPGEIKDTEVDVGQAASAATSTPTTTPEAIPEDPGSDEKPTQQPEAASPAASVPVPHASHSRSSGGGGVSVQIAETGQSAVARAPQVRDVQIVMDVPATHIAAPKGEAATVTNMTASAHEAVEGVGQGLFLAFWRFMAWLLRFAKSLFL